MILIFVAIIVESNEGVIVIVCLNGGSVLNLSCLIVDNSPEFLLNGYSK